jgi:hypothetical protein
MRPSKRGTPFGRVPGLHRRSRRGKVALETYYNERDTTKLVLLQPFCGQLVCYAKDFAEL